MKYQKIIFAKFAKFPFDSRIARLFKLTETEKIFKSSVKNFPYAPCRYITDFFNSLKNEKVTVRFPEVHNKDSQKMEKKTPIILCKWHVINRLIFFVYRVYHLCQNKAKNC